jgi:hypothetical protein
VRIVVKSVDAIGIPKDIPTDHFNPVNNAGWVGFYASRKLILSWK